MLAVFLQLNVIFFGRARFLAKIGRIAKIRNSVLGHPDQPHFPPPPPPAHHPAPPPLARKKSPSQLRCQERRKLEAQLKAGSIENNPHADTEKPHLKGISTNEKKTKFAVNTAAQEPAV